MMAKYQIEQTPPYGESVARLIDQFNQMPGIGRKSAERLGEYVVNLPSEKAHELASAITTVKEKIKRCETCFTLTESNVCDICRDPNRDSQIICVVEQPKDILSLEASGVFRGKYHVLHGCLSPLNGIGPDQLTISELVKRVRTEQVEEILMATNPTLEGDGTALYISNLLQEMPVKITRLARGIASGSVLEFANRDMIADAIRGRQDF